MTFQSTGGDDDPNSEVVTKAEINGTVVDQSENGIVDLSSADADKNVQAVIKDDDDSLNAEVSDDEDKKVQAVINGGESDRSGVTKENEAKIADVVVDDNDKYQGLPFELAASSLETFESLKILLKKYRDENEQTKETRIEDVDLYRFGNTVNAVDIVCNGDKTRVTEGVTDVEVTVSAVGQCCKLGVAPVVSVKGSHKIQIGKRLFAHCVVQSAKQP